MKNGVRAISALVLGLAVLVSCAAQGSNYQEGGMPPMQGPGGGGMSRPSMSMGLMSGQMLLMRIQRLDLKDEQREDVQRLMMAAREDNEPIETQVSEREERLLELLTTDTIDVRATRSMLENISVMREQIGSRWLDAYIIAWNSLDEKQREQLRETASEPILPEQSSQERRQPPRGGMGGGPPGGGMGGGGMGGW